MHKNGARGGLVVVLALTLAASFQFPASAMHNWEGRHTHVNSEMEVWAATSHFSSTGLDILRKATVDFSYSWNRWTSYPHAFEWKGTKNCAAVWGCGAQMVSMADLSCLPSPDCGVTYALTTAVTAAHEIVQVWTQFNDHFGGWYVGTSTVPSNKMDFWSVASHEFGHWHGLGDLPAGVDPACPGDTTDATMCTLYQGTDGYGTARRRQPDTAEDQDSIDVSAEACRTEKGVCVPFITGR